MTNPHDKAIEAARDAINAILARDNFAASSGDMAEAAIAAYERAREQGGVSEPSAPSEWQKRGPDFNEWEIEWERFAAMLADAKGEYFWIYDGALKYLNIRLDTRSNAFILYDRDDNRIDPARVEEAIRQCREEQP